MTTSPTSSQPRPPRQPTQGPQTKRRQRGPDLYAHPLPLLLPLTPPSSLTAFLAPVFRSSTFSNPHCRGTWDPVTRSVWVTEQAGIEVLWRRGFWGKGSLSRSEPTWLQRARNRKALELDAERQHLRLTAEEITAQRRVERREAKILKAKEKLSSSVSSTPLTQPSSLPTPTTSDIAASAPLLPATSSPKPTAPAPPKKSAELPPELAAELDAILDVEHLQLLREDAFFLLWGLGCLSISFQSSPSSASEPEDDFKEPQARTLSVSEAWLLFLSAASPAENLHVSNPFLISYVAYHHFRSLGWVVRSGIKFCTDFVLYGVRGPVGSHAEFAVCVIPTFEDPHDDPANLVEEGDQADLSRYRKSWRWFSTVNRVCAGVKKTLVFAYVVVPSSKRCGPHELASPDCIRLFKVREVAVRRFIPARMRD